MAKSLSTRLTVIGAALAAAALPSAAMAQEVPATPDQPDVDDVRTGTRLPMIQVIGAIRDPRAGPRAETPADRTIPELPVVYEDGPAPRR